MPHGDVPVKNINPLPPASVSSGEAESPISKAGNERAALLGSICSFDKSKLRRIVNGNH